MYQTLFSPHIGEVTGGLVVCVIVMLVFAESLSGMPPQPAVVQWIAVPPSKIKGDTKIATRTGNFANCYATAYHFIHIYSQPDYAHVPPLL